MDRFSVLPFRLAGQQLAVPLENVIRVIPALKCTPLPGAPQTVLGLVNLRGQMVPVIDLARCFAWPSPPLALWQPFLWLRSSHRDLLAPVEAVETACEFIADHLFDADRPQVPSQRIRGVLRTDEGMLLIQDVEQLLSDAEEQQLQHALETVESGDDDA